MLLLDTSFLTRLAREEDARRAGPATALLRAHAARRTVVSLITAGELLEWFDRLDGGTAFIKRHTIVGLSMPIAERAALLQRRLRRRLGENDAWLAATALHHDYTLVTGDRDFDRVPRLKLLRV